MRTMSLGLPMNDLVNPVYDAHFYQYIITTLFEIWPSKSYTASYIPKCTNIIIRSTE